MRKVLVIAYSFPPVGGGRVRRVLKFVKYLRDFGWEPVVLTVKHPIVSTYDADLIKEIPVDIEIIRTTSLEIRRGFIDNLKAAGKSSKMSVFKQRLYKFFDKAKWWVFFPDTRVGWVPFAIAKGARIIKQKKIDLILVMGEPFSSFLAGVILKFLTRRPLVLDFRDEWSEFSRYFYPQKGVVIRALERKLEAFVIAKSDRVISVTEAIVDNFKIRYSKYKDRFICITNGFDPIDFENISKKISNNFIITYAGSLYKFRSPKYFLEAIEQCIDENPHILDKLRIVFIGTIEPDLHSLFNNPIIKDIVSLTGFLKYRDTLEHLANSDVLLYIEDQLESADRSLPAKLFDYLALKIPILALARSSLSKDIIEKANAGKVISQDDIGEIKKTIVEYFNKFSKGGLGVDIRSDIIQQFDRRYLTGELSRVLNSLIKS